MNLHSPITTSQHALFDIEQLVSDCIHTNQQTTFSLEDLRYLLVHWAKQYQSHYQYAEYQKLFFDVCGLLGLLNTTQMVLSIDEVQQFIHTLLSHWHTDASDYTRRITVRRYEYNRRATAIRDYANTCLNRYAKLLVMRVDLCFLKEVYDLRIEQVYDALNCFNRSIQYLELYRHCVGYIWVIEQARDKGFHIHTVFMFNGHKHQKDVYLAQQIGEHWQRCAGSHSYYYNVNDNKADYEQKGICGIGMISRHNPQQVFNLHQLLQYFARFEKQQHLRVWLPRRRAFGMAQ